MIAPEPQRPSFLVNGGEYDFVPVPDATVSFQNPVRVRDINSYPWVFVENIQAPPAPEQTLPAVWVNMNFISVVKQRR